MSMSEYYNSRYPYVAEYNREEAADWADDYLETVYSGKGYTNKELVDLLDEADEIMKHLMAETNISKKRDVYVRHVVCSTSTSYRRQMAVLPFRQWSEYL